MAPTSTTTTLSPLPKQSIYQSEPLRERIVSRKVTGTEDEVTSANVMDMVVPTQIVWRNVALFAYLHLAAVYGLYLFLTAQVMWQTFLWGKFLLEFPAGEKINNKGAAVQKIIRPSLKLQKTVGTPRRVSATPSRPI